MQTITGAKLENNNGKPKQIRTKKGIKRIYTKYIKHDKVFIELLNNKIKTLTYDCDNKEVFINYIKTFYDEQYDFTYLHNNKGKLIEIDQGGFVDDEPKIDDKPDLFESLGF